MALLSNTLAAGLIRPLVRSWLCAYIRGPVTALAAKLWSWAPDQTSRGLNPYRKIIVLGT